MVRIPGFAAEASLYTPFIHYRTVAWLSSASRDQTVEPQSRCEPPNVPCGAFCCTPGETCCNVDDAGRAGCCPPGDTCGPDGCIPSCRPPRYRCDGDCCTPGEVCTSDGCCSPNTACNGRCCGPGFDCTCFHTQVEGLSLVGNLSSDGIDKRLSMTISDQAGAMVMSFDSDAELTTSTYTASWRFGAMVQGVQEANFVTTDGKLMQGTINGRQLMPFTAATQSLTFADGTPVPDPVFPPTVKDALQQMPAAAKSAILGAVTPPIFRKAFDRTPAAIASGVGSRFDEAANGNGVVVPLGPARAVKAILGADPSHPTFGSPPHIDDTTGTQTCVYCVQEAYAAAAACGVACGLSFGFGCICAAGIPLLFANCHAPGEELGKGCCPVACGPTHPTLGIGVVFQCCRDGESCADDSTGACCEPGLQPCQGTTCCPSNAPCRDEGICCPTNQNTCITPSGPVCCNPGEICNQGVCCPPGSPICNGFCCAGGVCDNSGNCCVNGACCPAGQDMTADGCCAADLVTPDRQHCGSRCGSNVCYHQYCCQGRCCDGQCCGSSCCDKNAPSCIGQVNGIPICQGLHSI
jgi:hypothetical protein